MKIINFFLPLNFSPNEFSIQGTLSNISVQCNGVLILMNSELVQSDHCKLLDELDELAEFDELDKKKDPDKLRNMMDFSDVHLMII